MSVSSSPHALHSKLPIHRLPCDTPPSSLTSLAARDCGLSRGGREARDCGLSYESAAAGYKYSGLKGYVWSPASRLGGVSMEAALRTLVKCDFSVRGSLP
jgi:hypothetical protein